MCKRRRFIGFVFLLLFLFGINQFVSADETWLYSIDNLTAPHAVAVAPDGTLKVVETTRNRIKTLDAEGNLLSVKSSQRPTAFAVDSLGNIYVGTGKYSAKTPPFNLPGEVKVYNNNLIYSMSLGSGEGEFINPSDIFIDADGKIYVTDSEADNVKVFLADGSFVLTFGRNGVGDGFLNQPVAVTVDSASGEIYVADRQLVSGDMMGAGIQVFDGAGMFLRGFGDFPADGVLTSTSLITPSDLLLANGKLYVADSFQNLVHVYDAVTGEHLYLLYDPNDGMRTAGSLDMNGDGLIFVSSTNTDSVHVFGVDGYVAFSVSPWTVRFGASEGGANPADQDITIHNTGAGTLEWTASTDDEWITLTNTTGTVDAGSTATVPVGVDISSLAAGTYRGSVSITSAGGTVKTVAVILTVAPPATLTVSDSEVPFTAPAYDGSINSRQVTVTLSNAPGMTWTASDDADWLSVNPVEAGEGATDATVSVSAANLAAGSYTGSIMIASAAVPAPAVITVTLDVFSTGTIKVRSNMKKASFKIAGPKGLEITGSGDEWSKENLEDGEYTITFDPIPGFITPPSSSKTISGGNIITFAGEYAAPRAVSVVATLDRGKMSDTRVVVINPDGKDSKFVAFQGVRGGLDTAVADVNGDGSNEIVASVLGRNAKIGVFTAAGNAMAVADGAKGSSGAYVDAADIDGDGDAEIVVAPRKGSTISVLDYVDGALVDAGVSITASAPSLIAAGDIDADGSPELVTLTRGGLMAVWNAQTGQMEKEATLGIAGIKDIAIADVNGDGSGDILVASGTDVFIVDIDALAATGLAKANGIRGVDAGDVNGDGNVEIVAGRKRGKITLFSADGAEMSVMKVFRTKSGVRVSSGVLGY